MSSHGSVPKLFPLSRRFNAGDLIGGKYRLVRQIGAGAMGAVWVAHNDLLDVDVAIKLLRVDNQRADPQRLYKRLLQEARAAARLGHPGIVRVFDFGRAEDNSPFIVMELLEGESLADVMARQRRTQPVKAVQLLLPIIDALATAHGRGIVHRDIKPENIFLSQDEYGRIQPKIVDFGVARFAEAGRSLTRSGALLGTPDYMAPEQARGELDIDHRVDIWALSTVLYELVTGYRPFGRDSANYLAVLRAIVHEPPPSILQYGIGDPALWLIIDRGLRKRQTDRWETMRVLGEALALWLYERGIVEDALGASLKTTWLESGLDGVKIDVADSPSNPAASFEPPPNSERPPPPPSRTLNPHQSVPSALDQSGLHESMNAEPGSPALLAPLSESPASVFPSGAPEARSSARWYFAALLFAVCGFGAAMWLNLIAPDSNAMPLPAPVEVQKSQLSEEPAETATQPSAAEPVVAAETSTPKVQAVPTAKTDSTATQKSSLVQQKAARAHVTTRPATSRVIVPTPRVTTQAAATATPTPTARSNATTASTQSESTSPAPRPASTTTPTEQSRSARKKSLPPTGSYDFGF